MPTTFLIIGAVLWLLGVGVLMIGLGLAGDSDRD